MCKEFVAFLDSCNIQTNCRWKCRSPTQEEFPLPQCELECDADANSCPQHQDKENPDLVRQQNFCEVDRGAKGSGGVADLSGCRTNCRWDCETEAMASAPMKCEVDCRASSGDDSEHTAKWQCHPSDAYFDKCNGKCQSKCRTPTAPKHSCLTTADATCEMQNCPQCEVTASSLWEDDCEIECEESADPMCSKLVANECFLESSHHCGWKCTPPPELAAQPPKCELRCSEASCMDDSTTNRDVVRASAAPVDQAACLRTGGTTITEGAKNNPNNGTGDDSGDDNTLYLIIIGAVGGVALIAIIALVIVVVKYRGGGGRPGVYVGETSAMELNPAFAQS